MIARMEEHVERQLWVTGEGKVWELLQARQEASVLIWNTPSEVF